MVVMEGLVTKNLSKHAIEPDILENSGFRGLDYQEISVLKSMLINKDFLI